MIKRERNKTLLILISIISLLICGLMLLAVNTPSLSEKHFRESLTVYDRNGEALRMKLSENYTKTKWVSLENVSNNFIDTVIISEDRRFFYHSGIDPIAIIRAMISNLRSGSVVSGASTITQQVIRILRPRPRTFTAKLYEALEAFKLELIYSKNDILEYYVNILPFGNQIYGIGTAANIYFDKSPHDLSTAESALLAILPRAPTYFNPYKKNESLKRLQHNLINRLRKHNKISESDKEIAINTKINIKRKKTLYEAPHVVDMLLKNRGVDSSLETTLDLSVQRDVERIVKKKLKNLYNHNVTNAAVVVMRNENAEIMALLGSADFFEYGIDGQVNGALALRQPGSTLKPFMYALALERGFNAASVLPDVEMDFSTDNGVYSPKNYDRKYRGPVTLRFALANSLNVPAVYTLNKIGIQSFLNKLHELGFNELNESSKFYGLGLTLGNGEVRLLDLVTAYSAIARQGIYMPYRLTARAKKDHRQRIFSETTTYIISDILSDKKSRRVAFGEDSALDLPFRVAAKTGTSKNFRDNWTIGYTPEYTVGVWVGNFDGTPMKGISGITGAGPIFKEIFLYLNDRFHLSWFDDNSPDIVHETICPLSGKLAGKTCGPGIDEIFVGNNIPKERCSVHIEKRIDRRNMLLATGQCKSHEIYKKIYLNLPPIYYEWMKNSGISRPPSTVSPFCKGTYKGIKENKKAETEIIHPENGSVYIWQKNIPPANQIIYFRATGDEKIAWSVNDRFIGITKDNHEIKWPVKKGKYRIEAKSKGSSDTIEIEVN